MNLANGIQKFYVRCKAKGVSENTILTYGYLFNQWMRYCINKGITDIDDIDTDALRNYFVKLQQDGYSPATVQDVYRSLKALWHWWEQEDIVQYNPMTKVERPKHRQERGRVFTASEIDIMLDYWNKETFIGLRNYTIIAILLGTGLRKAELLQLRLDDIDADSRTMTVFGKGGKYRDVPISRKLWKIMSVYIKNRNEYVGKSSGWLIVSRYGGRLTVGGVNKVFADLKRDTSIPTRKLSAHTLRRTYATAFLTNGGNLFVLQEILGHSDIATTRIYANFTSETRRQQQEEFSPLDNRRWKI